MEEEGGEGASVVCEEGASVVEAGASVLEEGEEA